MTSKEEKYQRFLDAQEHPEKYSDEQLDAILHDTEDIVSLKRAFMQERTCSEPVDTDTAWSDMLARHNCRHESAACSATNKQRQWTRIAAAFAGGVVATSVAFAAIVGLGIMRNPLTQHKESTATATAKDTTATKPATTATATRDSTTQKHHDAPQTVIFDNATLSDILRDMAAYYHAEVSYGGGSDASDIRLRFEWNQAKSLADNIALLNSFQQINIVLEGNRITVE